MLAGINYGILFCGCFGLMLLFAFIMCLQSLNFYTKDVVIKKFNIIELEIPASAKELVNLIGGLYLLPQPHAAQAVRSLKAQLRIDFIFMPFAYGAIFLLCNMLAHKMDWDFGMYVFLVLGWAQIIPWICDIIENIYLLKKIKAEPEASSPKVHSAYLRMEIVKWTTITIAAVAAFAALCYFWLAGNYSLPALKYILIVAAELILFLLLSKLFLKRKVI